MRKANRVPDRYTGCTTTCAHDLATGVLIGELLRVDGPHPPLMPTRRQLTPVSQLRRAG